MNRTLAFCVASLIAIAPVTVGQAAEGGGRADAPCQQIADANVMLECEKAAVAKEDAALNAAYRKLYAFIKPYQRDSLQKAERAWIQYRDAECAFAGAQAFPGALLGEMTSWQAEDKTECLVKVTQSQVENLDAFYKEAWENTPKPIHR